MKATFLVIIAACLLIGGCAKSRESQLIGKWSSDNQVVELKEGHVFQTDGQEAVKGTWALADNIVSVQVDTINGKPKEQAIDDLIKQFSQMPGVSKAKLDEAKAKALDQLTHLKFTVAEDNKTMTMESAAPGQKTVTLTKQS